MSRCSLIHPLLIFIDINKNHQELFIQSRKVQIGSDTIVIPIHEGPFHGKYVLGVNMLRLELVVFDPKTLPVDG